MYAKFTEDCISTSPLFGATKKFRIVVEGEMLVIRTYGTASGMEPGEFKDRVAKDPMNQLHLQSATHDLFDACELALRPTSSTVAVLSELYMSNTRLPPSQRRRFDNVTELQSAPHTLEIRKTFNADLFLKHPITGEVTIHQRPYANLPLFYPRTAHPITTSHNAFNFLVNTFSGFWYNDSLCVALSECEDACNALEHSLAQVSTGGKKPPAPQVKATRSSKRKTPSDQGAPCAKRVKRNAGCLLDAARSDVSTRKTLAVPTVATFPSRKRKAPCEQDGPHSKRTRRTLANL
ncbi:hypothetical protein CYLTODRAFT_493267 [Cylindrobasidium torrendii FP15055 ss-10]|uniref:Uncharacterized protein n=1 Tax=Cylindrobasidium torrendii FP15055 ss-10 TaxID=1314674 RepID=A0A0D7B407_9AGAR|nr:hypothetical protein CYLTODRAFT_493267 [Cylindrobasidium torrendii FP15055 ss-10]